MNFLVVIVFPSIAEYDHAVGLNAGFDQLAKAGDAETGRQVGGVLAVALHFAVIDDTAALGSSHADHEVEVVFLEPVSTSD